MRRSQEAAVSDVLGSILLVGITVLMAAAFGAVLLSYDGPSDTLHAQLAVEVSPGADGDWGTNDAELTITHLGGEPLDQGDTRVRYRRAAGTLAELTPTFAGGTLKVGQSWTATISANQGEAIQVDVIVDQGASAAILSGGTAAAGGAASVSTYVASVTAIAGWGAVTAPLNAAAANDGLDATLQESAVTGTTTTNAFVGSTGTVTNSGASGSQVKLSDDNRAVLDVAGDWIQGNTYPNNAGGVVVTDLTIGFEGRGTRTCSTVSWVSANAEGTAAGGASSVSTATVSITAGAVYVAVVTIGNTGTAAAPDVTSITGTLTGLAWTEVAQTPTLTGTNRIEVWVGTGTALTGVVTANFASALESTARAAISVARFTGMDTTNPIEGTAVYTSGTGTAASVGPVSGTATNGRFFGAVNGFQSGGVSWSGATERSDFNTAQSRARLTTADAAFGAGALTATATLSSSQAWQALGVALRPSCSAYPQVQLSYQLSGAAAGTPQTFQLTGTDANTYSISVIGDRAWSVADLANLGVRATLVATVSGSTAEIDLLYITLTTSDSLTQYRGDFRLNFNGVPAGATNEVVQLRYRTNGADSFTAAVWNPTTSTWRTCPGLLNAIVYTVFSCTVAPAEHAATNPSVQVRILDSTPAGTTRGTLLLDYARVATS